MHHCLISVEELARGLESEPPALFDCRFDLMRPEWGRLDYLDGHIPGAVYVSLDEDLSGPPLTDQGRHPMPSAQALTALFSRLGIAPRVRVVVYDQREGSQAARLWWLLRYMGHEAVQVLDGGLAAWRRAGLAERSGPEVRAPATFAGDAERTRLVRLEDIPGLPRIVDARAGARYRGEHEPLDRVAGHIPGARTLPFMDNLDEDGCFLPAQQVRAKLEAAFDGVPASQVTYSCGSGVTACHLALAAAHAGLDRGRLYGGSFSEWCRDPERPVATGDAPGSL